MILEFVLDGLLHRFRHQKGQYFQNAVRNVLFQSEQIVEVDEAILGVQRHSHLVNKLLREAYVIIVAEKL